MGELMNIGAEDGFVLTAYRASPVGPTRGALVVIQEVFGVNGHIRRLADGFAADGYDTIAPALYDRIEPDVRLGYGPEGIKRGMELKGLASTAAALRDIDAARRTVAPDGRCGVVGYCWGGYLSWLSATRLGGFGAAIVYYGGGIGSVAQEEPGCPVLMHFGERDTHIPLSAIDAVREAHPTGVEIHLYPADHGFNCDERASFDAPSAALARQRTLGFLAVRLT